ncbi:MAG: MFS transporter [Candidatus Magasanikbacteria bacterium]|jgi:predicted MFS family arabinose efflux permease|nr:MFS transporter [Candidatus Magasanikbacteria bacterium]MBT4220862.1 MFS transporter [Candidatus Magasanikbacteria bacterium]MBT4350865.1 MFS transporter [Candidatus Magasanikbacteria bacterium]MBT4541793.1 MFS transporter [Candidatus Magasanikbacteria bacterium]MBT6253553.1 MFS transporter [Candidatus Magasanikbacteria bacterium]
MKKPFLNKALRILLSTNAMILMAGAMLGPIYAIFVEDVGGDLLDASLAGGIFALVAGITTLLSGKYSDKIRNSKWVIILGYAIMGLGFLSYVWVDSVIYLFIVGAIIGLGEAIYSPVFDALYSKHMDKRKAGALWGAWESMDYFTAAVGAIIGGAIVTAFGFEVLFISMASLCFVSALYIYILKEKVL